MIYGIGVDLVTIARLQKLISRFDNKIARKLLTADEYMFYETRQSKATFLASRFAAKEAFAKALGTGFRNGLSLRHIEITADNLGKPVVKLHAVAQQLIDKLGISHYHVSISHEKEHVIAIIVLER